MHKKLCMMASCVPPDDLAIAKDKGSENVRLVVNLFGLQKS